MSTSTVEKGSNDAVNQLMAILTDEQKQAFLASMSTGTTTVKVKPKSPKTGQKMTVSKLLPLNQCSDSGTITVNGYGTAVTVKTSKKFLGKDVPNGADIHKFRVEQLESAIPGISDPRLSGCVIRSTGLNGYWQGKGDRVNSRLTTDFNKMVNSPFTAVELPYVKGNKNKTAWNGLTWADIQTRLKACGYSFSPKNCLWVTDSSGNSARQRGRYRATGAIRATVDEE